jgi:hypothetical protein
MIMSEKQLHTPALGLLSLMRHAARATRLSANPTSWALLALAGASAKALGQSTDLGVPNFNSPLYTPPSLSLTPPTSPTDSGSDFVSLGASGGDQGVLHDVHLTRDLPYIAPESKAPAAYNIKLGDATMSFTSAVSMAYSDNALQATAGGGGHDDFTFTPSLGIQVNVPLNREHSFRVNIGVGYRYSLNYSQLSSLYIAPSSYIDYQFKVGDVVFTFYDQLTSSADTTSRVDFRRQGTANGVDFNRLGNQIGLSVSYSLTRETAVVASYGFSIDRGLNDSYSSFDSNVHIFSTAVYHRLNNKLTLGLSGAYTITEFQKGIYKLNNSSTWSVGPIASFRPTEMISISAATRYTSISYERIGGFQTASNPSSITFDLSASHRVNRYVSHYLSAARAYINSLSSAQMETYTFGYGLSWQATHKLVISPSVNWQNFQQNANLLGTVYPTQQSFVDALEGKPGPSGAPLTAADLAAYYSLFSFQDKGNYITASLSGSYQFGKHLGTSLSYGHSARESGVTSKLRPSGVNSYQVNTVVLTLSYRF